jgi:hypothetical protein
MKVVCVKNINEEGEKLSLTLGKVYFTKSSMNNTTLDVINDKGIIITYLSDRFKDLSEVRSERIDKILEW